MGVKNQRAIRQQDCHIFFPFSPLLSSTHNSLAHFYCLSTDHHSTLCSELMAEDDFLLALEYSYFSTAT